MLYVGPRSALTSHTAAALYGCTAADTGTIHVLSGYDRKVLPRPGFMLHQGFYEEPDVLKLDGLRAIALEIALAELLCTAPRPLALACADQALAGFDARLQATLRDEIAKRLQSRIDPRGTRRAEVLLGLASGLPESPRKAPCSWRSTMPGFRCPSCNSACWILPAGRFVIPATHSDRWPEFASATLATPRQVQ